MESYIQGNKENCPLQLFSELSFAFSFNSSRVYKFTGNTTISWRVKEKGAGLTFFFLPRLTSFPSFLVLFATNFLPRFLLYLFWQTRLFLLLYKWSLHPLVFIWVSTLRTHIDYFFVLDQEFLLPVPINLWCWVATSAREPIFSRMTDPI